MAGEQDRAANARELERELIEILRRADPVPEAVLAAARAAGRP